MPQITVYTTTPCAYCSAVKELLREKGLPFQEVNLAKDHEGRAALAQRTGMLTFPQVLLDGRLVGGYEETRAALQGGALDRLLRAA